LASGNNLNGVPVQTISLGGSKAEPRRAQSRVSDFNKATTMILPLLLSVSLWLPLSGVYTQLLQQTEVFKPSNSFKPSELQALNIKLDFGNSPEPKRLSRREKIALKLTQITKTITN
jgi:hypothetical protein